MAGCKEPGTVQNMAGDTFACQFFSIIHHSPFVSTIECESCPATSYAVSMLRPTHRQTTNNNSSLSESNRWLLPQLYLYE